ncbi:hypothetical protein LTR66_016326 [Elasticomyces elasticus]|nr:hypothetical protein LTR66_016326 [Elasticomyces elasticus]
MGSMPELFSVSSPLSTRTMVIRRRSVDGDRRSIFYNAFTIATTQQSVIADGLTEVGRLWAYAAHNSGGRNKFIYRRDALFSTTAPQPIVQTRCEETVIDFFTTLNTISFPNLATPHCDGDISTCQVIPTSFTSSSNATLLTSVNNALQAGQPPSLMWLEDDELKPHNSSIVALAMFPQTANGDRRLYRCTIDAVMANSTIQSTRNSPRLVTGYATEFKDIGTSNTSWSRVSVSPSWADLLNPTISTSNTTVFAHTTSTAGLRDTATPSYPYNYPFIIESTLTLMVTNGLARTTYNLTLAGSLLHPFDPSDPWSGGLWQQHMIPPRYLSFNGPQSIFNPSSIPANATKFTMHARVTGYAWSSDGAIQKASMIILSIYIMLAVAHVAYSGISGESSNAWDNVPELVALAAQSQRADVLHDTGAGITTVDPVRVKVRVRNVDGHLEYTFGNTWERGGPVRSNCD